MFLPNVPGAMFIQGGTFIPDSRVPWDLAKFQLNQTTDRKNENKDCLIELNELKFCEVSRNYISK